MRDLVHRDVTSCGSISTGIDWGLAITDQVLDELRK